MPSLVYRGGQLAGYRYEISGEMSLGRENAAIQVADSEVSRRHAVIRAVEGGLEVQDLGSTNGTWVNGKRIEGPTLIRPGDVLRLGQIEFEVAVEEVAAPAPQPEPAPQQPHAFGAPPQPPPQTAFQAQPRPTRRGPATRSVVPVVLTFGIIVATAVLLVLYFGLRG